MSSFLFFIFNNRIFFYKINIIFLEKFNFTATEGCVIINSNKAVQKLFDFSAASIHPDYLSDFRRRAAWYERYRIFFRYSRR